MFGKRKTGFDEPEDPDGPIEIRNHHTVCAPETDVPDVHWSLQELVRPAWTCEMLNLASRLVADS